MDADKFVGIPKKGKIVSQSKYFGKSFIAKEIQGEGPGGHLLFIGEHPGEEDFTPHPGEHFDQALVGLVDTLRVTRKLLKECVRRQKPVIGDANGYHRDITNLAKKFDELPDRVQMITDAIYEELFNETIVQKAADRNR